MDQLDMVFPGHMLWDSKMMKLIPVYTVVMSVWDGKTYKMLTTCKGVTNTKETNGKNNGKHIKLENHTWIDLRDYETERMNRLRQKDKWWRKKLLI